MGHFEKRTFAILSCVATKAIEVLKISIMDGNHAKKVTKKLFCGIYSSPTAFFPKVGTAILLKIPRILQFPGFKSFLFPGFKSKRISRV